MPYQRFLTTLLFLATGLASSTPIECSAQVSAPEYEARGNRLVHKAPGGYGVEVDSSLRYVGGERFRIRSAADAEQHLFAQSDADGHVLRLVWIQFESQLPGQSWRYSYPSPDRVRLGELEFIADARVYRSYGSTDPASDHAVMDRQLRDHGFSLPGPVMRLRMIYLPDSERRRELMVIYAAPMPASESARIPDAGGEAAGWPAQLMKIKAGAARDVKVRLAARQ